MTKRQRFVVNTIVLYAVSITFAVILLIQNPINRLEDKTLFHLTLNGNVRESLVFSIGLRHFYSAETLIITPEAYNHLELTPGFIERFAGISTFEIRQLEQSVDLSGLNLIEEYNLSPEVNLRFLETDATTLYAFLDGSILIIGG